MPKVERIREVVTGSLDPDYLKQRVAAGWEPVAIEWQRKSESGASETSDVFRDVPYGCRVSKDCLHLEENPSELEALTMMLAMMVQDCPFPRIAEALNQKGFRTREGAEWSVVRVYNLVPRLIEIGPQIFSNQNWVDRRTQLSHAG